MIFEKSAGVVVFRKTESGEILYLLLKSTSGYLDFPKGNIEKGESEEQTMKREVEEETGLKDIVLVEGFKEKIKYFYRMEGQPINKEVIYFLGETKTEKVMVSWEHIGFEWMTFKDAFDRIKFENAKNILKKANEFLTVDKGLGKFLNK